LPGRRNSPDGLSDVDLARANPAAAPRARRPRRGPQRSIRPPVSRGPLDTTQTAA